MTDQVSSFAAGLAVFGVYVGAFFVLVRTPLRLGWFALQVGVGGIIHVLSSVVLFLSMDGFLYWHALGVFSVCWFSFFTLSTAIYVSVSARIMRTIYRQPGHALSQHRLFSMCIREPFQERAGFLVASGLALKEDDRFRIAGRGAKQARRVRAMRRLFGMEGSGLYS